MMDAEKEYEVRFWNRLKELEENPEVQKLRLYPQHETNNSFQHSHNVAIYSFYLSKKWGWKIHPEDLATGAMLHDFYLYDIKKKGITDYQHGVQHPRIALENAKKIFSVSPTVENMILSHMWPLPFVKRPRSKEALLLSAADKCCAFWEMHGGMQRIEEKIGEQGNGRKG